MLSAISSSCAHARTFADSLEQSPSETPYASDDYKYLNLKGPKTLSSDLEEVSLPRIIGIHIACFHSEI